MAQKITRWLLIALILSLGFGQLLRFDLYGLPLYLHDVLVICLLIMQSTFIWRVLRHTIYDIRHPVLGIFLLGLALGWLRALTLYPLSSLLIPSLYSLRLLSYLTLYLVLKSQKIALPRSLWLTTGMLSLTIGLLQYFLLPDMRVFQYLGWDDHLNRLTLPHFDPTFSAVMLGLMLLSCFSLSRIIDVLYTIPITLAILLTYARSVWLSLVVSVVFFVKPKKILVFLFPILLLAIYALPHRFGEGTNLLRTYSISSRITNDLSVLKGLGWNILVGQGMSTFPRNSINNSYLYLLATTGCIGLVGFLLFLRELYRHSSHKGALIFVLVASLFNNVLFYPFALLWVLLIETQQNKLENWRI